MQRLFSAFPAGLAGLGILLLRLALGSLLIVSGAATLGGATGAQAAGNTPLSVLSAAWVLAGLLISAGLLTPLVQIVVAATILLAWVSTTLAPAVAELSAAVADPKTLALALSASLALLGPGAYSIDAYLFGRRQINIPATRKHDTP